MPPTTSAPSSAPRRSTRPAADSVGRPVARRALVTTVARAAVAAGLVVVAELLVALLARGEQLSSVWELQMGLLWLLPVLVVFALAGGALGTLLVRLATASAPGRPARVLFAVLVASLGAAFAWGISGGRLLGAQWLLRAAFIVGVSAVAGAGGFVFAPVLGHLAARRPAWLAIGAALAIVAAEIINRFVLVRLYPAFHIALSASALILAAACSIVLPRRANSSGRPAAVAAGAGLLLALVCAPAAAARLSHFDNFRLFALETAPLLGHAVQVAARLSPPKPIADTECIGSGCRAEVAAARSLDLRGRDVLLITIDALRADHLGAYGYSRRTSPNIDELAHEGRVFERAYAATPHTSYSITSIMTGKYMRPLLLQDAGRDSDTWAGLLRTYGYRTAAFYPPAVFFIDTNRFTSFRDTYLNFEYRKVEFLEGAPRVAQFRDYLGGLPPNTPVFAWVHLFGPHEPYEAHAEFPFGDRDVDRYDSEIAAVDATVGQLVKIMRARSPAAAVIVTADHGEEFGEHGGRYHGTTVYEEQVRVPLIWSAPGAVRSGTSREVVQTIDILPTVLTGLDIPRPPRMRGRDLGALLSGARADEPGVAFAETEDQALLASGTLRLICERKLGACQLYDLAADPGQRRDVSGERREQFEALRKQLQQLAASHGRYEVQGLRAEGKGWPAPILRGLAGDADAAAEVAALLDDAERDIRRKAAELLFELKRSESAPALRLALGRDEDPDVRSWAALALTRLGEGAPLVYDLLKHEQLNWRRLAALALAEAGDGRGQRELVAWWSDAPARSYDRSRQLLDALATIKAKDAVWPLMQSLEDVRLRPYIASALARIGDDAARGALAAALAKERYQSARQALASALVDLGGEYELAVPLTRFLGVPDPIVGGVGLAARAGILPHVGGPVKRDLPRLREQSELGALVQVVIPRAGNNRGVRAIVRARAPGGVPGEVRIGLPKNAPEWLASKKRTQRVPELDATRSVRLNVPATTEFTEVFTTLPAELGLRPASSVQIVVFADRGVEVDALVLVPLADELPPPPPEPWRPGKDG